MSELRAIRIERGPQGFGGPLIIRPTEQKNKVMYITGGGDRKSTRLNSSH